MNIITFPFQRLIIGIVGLLLIMQITVVVVVSSFGKQLAQLEKEQETLKRANQELVEEIDSNSSLLAISSKAAELGLAKTSNFIYLPVVNSLAQTLDTSNQLSSGSSSNKELLAVQ